MRPKQCCTKAVVRVPMQTRQVLRPQVLKGLFVGISPWDSMVTFKTAGDCGLPQAAVWASKAECTMLPLSRSAIPSGGWYTCHVIMRAASSWLARAIVLPVDQSHRQGLDCQKTRR